jgi:hypothetical protein
VRISAAVAKSELVNAIYQLWHRLRLSQIKKVMTEHIVRRALIIIALFGLPFDTAALPRLRP